MSATKMPSRECECNMPNRAVESDSFPVTYDEQMGEFHLLTTPSGHAAMRFCPWCGGAFPESKRGSFFTEPRTDEEDEVVRLVSSISGCEDMRRILGSPDHTIHTGPPEKQRTQYTYSSKWETIELTIRESADGKLSFSYGGKYIDED